MMALTFDTPGRQLLLTSLALLLLALGGPSPATAGNWRVAPIKVFFDAKSRNEVITVTNDGDQPLTLEITAMAWSQDKGGQDVFVPADDLIFFPKQLVVEPKKERVIRTGVKTPAVSRERTYRLFIREVPDTRLPTENAVAIAIQFGVPIFVLPAKEEIKADIAEVVMKDGEVAVTIKNSGNSHFRINFLKLQVKLPGGELHDVAKPSGWYLLAGSERTFKATIPAELCPQADTLEILVEADRTTLSGSTNVDKTKCSAP